MTTKIVGIWFLDRFEGYVWPMWGHRSLICALVESFRGLFWGSMEVSRGSNISQPKIFRLGNVSGPFWWPILSCCCCCCCKLLLLGATAATFFCSDAAWCARLLLMLLPSAANAANAAFPTGKRSGSEGRNGDKMQPKKSLTCRLKPEKNCVKHGLPAALLLL